MIAELEEFLAGSRSALVVDRVLANVVFMDIVDSTQHADAKGDRAWRDLLEAHNKAVRRVLSRFRGKEVNPLPRVRNGPKEEGLLSAGLPLALA